MGLALAITLGFVLWIVLWAIGTKSFDAFMLTALIALVAATLRSLSSSLPGRSRND